MDTETTSTHAVDAELVGLSFAVEEKEAFYVAIPPDREEALKFVNIFKPLYENPKIMKVGQNIKYDYEVLMNYGVEIQGKMFDTMIPLPYPARTLPQYGLSGRSISALSDCTYRRPDRA